jgi:hypothetical protein
MKHGRPTRLQQNGRLFAFAAAMPREHSMVERRSRAHVRNRGIHSHYQAECRTEDYLDATNQPTEPAAASAINVR